MPKDTTPSAMRNSVLAMTPSVHSASCGVGEGQERSQRHQLYALLEQNVLTDVELVVQGECIAAHRVVLAAASPYFHALFTSGMKESHERRIELYELNAAAFRELVVYMYLGEIHVTGDTVLAILHTANQLEILSVVEICCRQLMLELNVSNCVDIYVSCEGLQMRQPCRILANAALAMIEAFLGDVVESEAFMQLSLPSVVRLLRHLMISGRKTACLRAWRCYDPHLRHHELTQLLPGLSSCQLERVNMSKPLKIPVLFALGGFNGPNALRSVEYLDFGTNEWFLATSMHERRSYSGIVVTGDEKIVVLAGSCSSRHLKSVEQYDPERNRWELLPSMRKARSYLGAVYLRGYIYVIGGFNGLSHLASVERFDCQTRQWEDVAPLCIGRSGLAVVASNDAIYAIGGYDGRRHLRTVEMYDPVRNEWTLLPHLMRHARNGPAAVYAPHKESILVYGGECRHGMRMDTSERLDLNTGVWEDMDHLVDCRSGHMAMSMLQDSFVFCLGGSNKKDEYVDAVHRYDPLNKQWMVHSRMLSQRCGLSVALVHVSRDADCFHSQPPSNRWKLRSALPSPSTETLSSSPSGVESVHAFASTPVSSSTSVSTTAAAAFS